MSAKTQNCEASRQLLLWNSYANLPIARQRFSKRHVTMAMLKYAKIEELLEVGFLCGPH
jgi:hypothetical protein